MVKGNLKPGSSPNQVEKELIGAIKAVLKESEIDPTTRKGNRELSKLLRKTAKENYQAIVEKPEEAKQACEDFGKKIVELSQRWNKKYLDGVVIREATREGGLAIAPTKTPTETPAETTEAQPETTEETTEEA